MESAIRSLVPDVHTLDRVGEHYRPGVVWAIAGATSTARVWCAVGDIREFTVNTSMLPNGAAVGAPLVAKFTSTAYSRIAALSAGTWARGYGPGTDEAGAVTRGEFFLCCIPRDITRAPPTWPEVRAREKR
jgi:hypothetical protein